MSRPEVSRRTRRYRDDTRNEEPTWFPEGFGRVSGWPRGGAPVGGSGAGRAVTLAWWIWRFCPVPEERPAVLWRRVRRLWGLRAAGLWPTLLRGPGSPGGPGPALLSEGL